MFPPNYSSLFKTLIASKALSPGKQLHAHILTSGLTSTALSAQLVRLYSACNSLHYARHLFDQIPHPNIFLHNILARAYAWHGPPHSALHLCHRMLRHGIPPDNFTLPSVLKACSALSDIRTGRHIHTLTVKTQWGDDVFVGAGLIDMYAKCGNVDDGRLVFDRIPHRDVVMWNSMMAAYSQNSRSMEALELFRDINRNGFQATVSTYVTAIAASAHSAKLPRGREIHGYSWRRGFGSDGKVTTALIDMYAKGGWVKVALRLFESLVEKGLVSWNAMISGYAIHGHTDEALGLFARMKEGSLVSPDSITFVGVLSACKHGGLLEEGRRLFDSMVADYGIKPTVQHYTCLIDLLGRAGRLEEAYQLIQEMPVEPDSGVWGALINAAMIHKNVEFGEMALRELIELEPDDAGNYVLLCNIYSQAEKWQEAAKVRKMMADRGLKKAVACSWIGIKNKVHAFVVGDTSHPVSEAIYAELERLEGLMNEAGYVPDTNLVFHDVGDDEKRSMVRGHSERLAIAFGLISTPASTTLLVTKNLRVCEDCHAVIKFISKIVEREIIIRDVNLYHHFKNGECSCKDYW